VPSADSAERKPERSFGKGGTRVTEQLPADDVRVPEGCLRDEATLAAALKPFGWTCDKHFWRRFYSDPWVFHLANAVEKLTEENARLRALTDGSDHA
jgi:hypothetical protein